MTGLFTANLVVVFLHIFKNVSVAYLGDFGLDTVVLAELEEAHIAHYGNNRRIVRENSPLLHILGADRNNLVAVNNLAVFINSQHSVSVTVESEAYITAVFPDISLKSVKVS